MPRMKKGTIKVMAAVLRRGDTVLIARRKAGSYAGYWEFPGGKLEEGETPEECLVRELREELSIEARIGAFIATSRDTDAERTIELIAHWAEIVSGELTPVDHDEILWILPRDHHNYKLAPSDLPIVEVVIRLMAAPN
jgi:8-oxo-dGTP diphosphatase